MALVFLPVLFAQECFARGTHCVFRFLFAENAFHTRYCTREIDKVPSEQNNDNFVINLVVIFVAR